MSVLRNRSGGTRWDWDTILLGAKGKTPFPRDGSTGDLDAELEINRRFLVLEGKRTGEHLSPGQRYAMNARALTGRTVIIVYGDPEKGEIEFLQHWHPDGQRYFLNPPPMIPGSAQDLWAACYEWSRWAEEQPAPDTVVASFLPPFAEVR